MSSNLIIEASKAAYDEVRNFYSGPNFMFSSAKNLAITSVFLGMMATVAFPLAVGTSIGIVGGVVAIRVVGVRPINPDDLIETRIYNLAFSRLLIGTAGLYVTAYVVKGLDDIRQISQASNLSSVTIAELFSNHAFVIPVIAALTFTSATLTAACAGIINRTFNLQPWLIITQTN